MPPWPNAEIRALWARILVCVALAGAFLVFHPTAHAETMRASFYGEESGRLNADGSRFDPMGFTAASRTLRFGTRLEVCLVRCAIVTVRDRGPYVAGRALDLARGAARAIGLEARGVADIAVRIIGRADLALASRHDRRPRKARRHRHHHR